MKKERLDVLLFARGLTQSRERARTEIMSGNVFVDGQRVDKPGTMVSPDARLELRTDQNAFVSRGGKKLEKALDVFQLSPTDKVCIDCGASTGGFTDCLLRGGARKVYAVDVGYGQLAWILRQDARVIPMERTNIRYVTHEQIPEELDLAVIDVSFISLRLVLPAVRDLLRPGGDVVCLIQPQFEAGRERVGKKGVVRDPAVHQDVIASVLQEAGTLGFAIRGLTFSPIKGPEGNIEYLGHLRLSQETDTAVDIAAVVAASHQELE